MSERDLLTRKAAALYISMKPSTLAVWAVNGRYHLPFIKIGRSVRYRREDLDEFLRSRTITRNGELGASK